MTLHTVQTMSLLEIFTTSFACEIFPDFLCFGVAWIWMIICDIIHNDISCLDVGLSFCVVKCAAAPLFTDQAAGQQELNGQQATQQC